MKFSLQCLLVLATVASTRSFSVSSRKIAALRRSRRTYLSMAEESSADKVAALRAAAQKARDDAERLRKELGMSSKPETATATVPKKSADQIKKIVPTLLSETDLAEQELGWKELKDSKSLTAFGSANLRTFPVSLNMLQDRSGLTADSLGLGEGDVDLDDFKFATLYVTGGCTVLGILSLAVLPPNIGATICYLLALIPILFLAIGSTAPAVIANAIAGIRRGGAAGDANAAGSPQERICRHEAAHFCCGYWCGLPIRDYSVQEGVARVEFAVANSNNFSATQVAALSVTALAGLVGEALKWNKVLPGTATADLLQLEQVLRKSASFVGSQQQQDLTRWGALTSSLLLRQNAAAYEKVVEAFGRQAPLEECIAILEE